MPNIKSAKKRVLITKKETVLNNDVKASMKTAIKKVEKAQTKEEAQIKLNEAIKRIDKATSSGLVHKNKAAREKSRLMKANK